MSEPQEAPKPQPEQQPAAKQTPPQQTPSQQPFYKDLPWLRFWCNFIFGLIFMGVFIWGGYLLWENTKPPKQPQAIKELIQTIKKKGQPVTTHRLSKENTKVEQEFKDASPSYYRNPFWFSSTDSAKTTIESTKEEDIPECYTIRMDDLDNALKAISLASRQEAAEDYHKSLSILIAMLTVFGIIFPIIVALIQNRFNERDLDKIEKTAIKADKTTKQVINIKSKAIKATNDATIAISNANNAITKATEAANQAKSSLVKAEKSLDESLKQKNTISHITQMLFDQFSGIDYLIYLTFNKQDNNYNSSILLFSISILFRISSIEIIIPKKDVDIKTKKEKIDLCIKSIKEFIGQIENLKKEDTEIMSFNETIQRLTDCFSAYEKHLVNIQNNLPNELQNEINMLQQAIQEGIDKVDEKANESEGPDDKGPERPDDKGPERPDDKGPERPDDKGPKRPDDKASDE